MTPSPTHDEFGVTSGPTWSRYLEQPSRLARVFFLMSCGVLGVAVLIAWGLIQTSHFVGAADRLVFPPAFILSTVFLAFGSWHLESACRWVRVERQQQFRQHLIRALAYGTAFVSAQTYGLWCFLTQQEIASLLGVRGGAFAFVVMHGVHFVVALLFVVFVLLRAFANRYDHEYSWGVAFCAWFWHVLGILWLIILGALLLASTLLRNEHDDWNTASRVGSAWSSQIDSRLQIGAQGSHELRAK